MWFSIVGGAKAENHGFQCGFQKWEEQGQKPQFSALKTAVFKSGRSLVKNCGFWPKTAVFSVVFQKWEEPS